MKKNAMLKIAAVLLVAVLLTTCAISSTFAKYVSSGKVYDDSARVAKWGIKLNLNAMSEADIFSDNYANGAVGTVGTKELVVAPGTRGELDVAGVVSGSAEVSAKIRYTVEVKTNGFPTDYKPVVVTTPKGAVTPDAGEKDAYVSGLINPNTTIDKEDEFKVTWEWPFEVDDDKDIADTALGTTGTATVQIIIRVYVEQTEDSVASNVTVTP